MELKLPHPKEVANLYRKLAADRDPRLEQLAQNLLALWDRYPYYVLEVTDDLIADFAGDIGHPYYLDTGLRTDVTYSQPRPFNSDAWNQDDEILDD